MAGRGKEATQFKSTGLGTTKESRTFGFRVSEKLEDVLLMLPNRSAKLRQWVIEGMLREGLIFEDDL